MHTQKTKNFVLCASKQHADRNSIKSTRLSIQRDPLVKMSRLTLGPSVLVSTRVSGGAIVLITVDVYIIISQNISSQTRKDSARQKDLSTAKCVPQGYRFFFVSSSFFSRRRVPNVTRPKQSINQPKSVSSTKVLIPRHAARTGRGTVIGYVCVCM